MDKTNSNIINQTMTSSALYSLYDIIKAKRHSISNLNCKMTMDYKRNVSYPCSVGGGGGNESGETKGG
jgi:hypothetical protein